MSTVIKLQNVVDTNQEYNYRGNRFRLLKWENCTGEYVLHATVNGEPKIIIKEDAEKVELFLECLKPIESISDIQSPAMAMYNDNKAVFTQLRNQLLDDIEKVKNDPKYVGQAKQVSNSINSLINLTKLQIQMINVGKE